MLHPVQFHVFYGHEIMSATEGEWKSLKVFQQMCWERLSYERVSDGNIVKIAW